MTQTISIAYDNLELWKEGTRLIETVTDELYTTNPPQIISDTMGSHVRHLLDHYFAFFQGMLNDRINYDKRARDPRIANNRKFAVTKVNEVIKALTSLDEEKLDTPIQVKMDCGESSQWVQSTPARELQFLVSHHLHHNALIRMILECQEFTVKPTFGFAPSTLKYKMSQIK